MLGVGCIIVCNSVFTDINFFITNLPNASMGFIVPVVLNIPQVIG